MFIAALFIIARMWKQPRCPSADEWVDLRPNYGGVMVTSSKRTYASTSHLPGLLQPVFLTLQQTTVDTCLRQRPLNTHRQHGVEETAAECRNLGATTHVFVVDCSNREEIHSSVNQVKKEVGDVTILVNNAGVIYPADLLSTKDEEIIKTFEVNILGHFWITKALLPSMIRRNHGHIVTVASVCGHGVIPYLIPYCSSKFAAVGFHRALTSELEALGKTGIKTSCLCPVFVNTGFTKNPSTRLWPVLETGEVVRSLIDGILTDKKMIFVPSHINISLTIERFLPERALAAINHVQDIQFEAVIGHKIKMK
ncbi:17-beta-hydroxysteroid dehydrogenase 13 isoform X1 [Moschus berezovskii]|uniref:17-beta-hydroxysteroid dehydrogenase 13 isoform X1 n=1 Tax=Moschus berezovskii TaxID=68408 RepID=UPI002443EEC0|nr:17-beta-hydroxysteroid dehydrogenase 13 isoform X1 [Moschus berezovskii]